MNRDVPFFMVKSQVFPMFSRHIHPFFVAPPAFHRLVRLVLQGHLHRLADLERGALHGDLAESVHDNTTTTTYTLWL